MENVTPTTTPLSLLTEMHLNVSSETPGKPAEPFDWAALRFLRIAMVLIQVLPPILLCIGTLGNVMTVVIMRRMTSSGDSTIHIYFTAIAGVDLLYLWTIVVNQTVQFNFGFDFKIAHGVVCKIITWLYTGGGTISAWYLVCMTVHRAMSVVWPHRVSSLCTRRTVLLMLAGVTVFYALLYSHYLIGYDAISMDQGGTYKCTLATPSYVRFHSSVFVYIELLLYSALPFVVLLLANSVLTWRLVTSVKTAKRNLTGGSSGQAQNREKMANSVTFTVMAVSLTFLILTLPSTINFILNHLSSTGHKQTTQSQMFRIYAISLVCTLLGHSNHAVNFYLYCLTGRRFREEFLRLLCCGRAGAPRLFQGSSSKDQAASG